MNNRFELPVAGAAQAAGVAPAVVVERLRMEAVLVERAKNFWVVEDQIALPYPGFVVRLWAEPAAGGGFQVTLSSHLGTVLFAAEARRLVAAGAVPTGAHRLRIDEENLVWLTWMARYAPRVTAGAVADALDEHAAAALQAQRVLGEECYLKPLALPPSLCPKGRF